MSRKNGEQVTTITLDSMNHNNVGFIHCDAQGAEEHIFSRGKELIKKEKPVIFYENNRIYNRVFLIMLHNIILWKKNLNLRNTVSKN